MIAASTPRQAGNAKAQHVERAQANADQDDAEPQDGCHAELEPGCQLLGERRQIAQEQSEDDGHLHPGSGCYR